LDRAYYYTSFYKLNKNNILNYFKKLTEIMKERDKYTKDVVNDFEVIIPAQIKNKIVVDHLGITQIFSCFDIIDNI
jgi:predicted glycosyltransferase